MKGQDRMALEIIITKKPYGWEVTSNDFNTYRACSDLRAAKSYAKKTAPEATVRIVR